MRLQLATGMLLATAIVVPAQPVAVREYMAGLESMRGGDPVAARSHFEASSRADPNYDSAYLGLVNTYVKQGSPSAALAELEMLAEGKRIHPANCAGMAWYAFVTADYPVFLERANDCRAAGLDAPVFYRAWAKSRSGDMDAMIADQKAWSESHSTPQARFGYALFLAAKRESASQATPIFEQLASEPPPLGFAVMDQLYYLHSDLASKRRVLEDLVASARKAQDSDWEIRMRTRLNIINMQDGVWDSVEQEARELIPLAQRYGYSSAQHQSSWLTWFYSKTGRLAEAEGEALLNQKMAAGTNEANAWNLRAEVAYRKGSIGTAVEFWNNAWTRLKPNQNQARVEIAAYLAECNVALAAPKDALDWLKKAEAGMGEQRLYETFAQIGRLYDALGDPQNAMVNFARSLAIKPDEVATLRNRAEAYAKLGRKAESEADWRKALSIAKPNGLRYDEGLLQILRSNAAMSGGRMEEALEAALESDRLAKEIGSDMLIWRAANQLAEVHWKAGRTGDALEHRARALQTLERMRADWLNPQQRTQFFAQQVTLYEQTIDWALKAGDAKTAWNWAERSRARTLRELAAESAASVDQPFSKEEIFQFAKVARGPEQPVSERELASEEAIWKARPRKLPNPTEPASLETIQRALGPKDGMLFFVWRPSGSVSLFGIDRDGIEHWPLGDSKGLSVAVRALTASLSTPPMRATYDDWAGPAFGVYRRLLRPAAQWMAKRERIVLVPDGPAEGVPWDALVMVPGNAETGAAPRLLGDRFTMEVAPSASLYLDLREKSGSAPPAPTLIAMGGFPTVGGGRSVPFTASRAGTNLAPLRHSLGEVKAISGFYPLEGRTVWLGEEASEDRIKSDPKVRGAAVLHFAVHAVADVKSPQSSGLFLAPSPRSSATQEDGWLRASEIAGVPLKARLVVLSACQTGIGPAVHGEGMMSLSRAFLSAGAQSVISTLWNADDGTASDLMIRFHRLWRAGSSAPAALQAAKRQVRRNPASAHPYYWAGFQFVGSSAGVPQDQHSGRLTAQQ